MIHSPLFARTFVIYPVACLYVWHRIELKKTFYLIVKLCCQKKYFPSKYFVNEKGDNRKLQNQASLAGGIEFFSYFCCMQFCIVEGEYFYY